MLNPANQDAIVVMDAGIATEDNIKWLTDNDYIYLVISRKRNPEIPKNIEGVVVKEDTHNKVPSYLVNNEAMEAKSDDFVEKFKQIFTDGLITMNNGLTKKRGTKKYAKIRDWY